jgi:hypothetical protein
MRRLVPLLVAVLLITACGSDDPSGGTTTTGVTGSSGSIHVSGGFAPIDETWILGADGTVLGPDDYLSRLTDDERRSLEAAINAARFFELDAEYLPDDECCDRRLYELTLTRGGVTHTVTTLDGAAAPESLFLLIQTLLEVVRPDV